MNDKPFGKRSRPGPAIPKILPGIKKDPTSRYPHTNISSMGGNPGDCSTPGHLRKSRQLPPTGKAKVEKMD